MPVLDLEEALNDSLTNLHVDEKPTSPKASPRCSSGFMTEETVHVQPIEQHTKILTPRPSAGATLRSTPTEKLPPAADQSNTPSSRESPISGKPPSVVGSIVSRAISRRETNPWTPIDQSYNLLSTSQNACSMAEGLDDDSILEPFPYERVTTNLSELIAATPPIFEGSIDLTRFGGHRDTFAILGLRRQQHREIDLPTSFFEHLLPLIDFPTYLAIRLCCRSWSLSISQVRPLATPATFRLPTEILQQIYRHLGPVDFNSARHTCRAWMIASLDPELLKHELKRGGWFGAAIADEDMIERSPQMVITNEWPLSKRLATECQLMPNWSGTGLLRRCAASVPSFDAFQQLSASTNDPALALGLEINFSKLTLGSKHASKQSRATSLNPSVCGKYVLVVNECTIYVFSLGMKTRLFHGDDLKAVEAVTSIVCPRRVLAVSMDTSYGCFAVAALLEDRIGLVCDLQNTQPRQENPISRIPSISWKYGSRWSLEGSDDEMEIDEPRPNSSLAFYNQKGEMCPWAKGESPLTDTPERYDLTSPETSIPVERGPRSIYSNVCSPEDPPRNVAICPQRRCVAFGCSAGIEIHWTDPSDGQNKTRWFPLVNPSDYLHFIPPRAGVDTLNRLRLASSVAHPSEQTALLTKFAPQMLEGRQDEMAWECTSNMAFDPCKESPLTDQPNHYHAVPLSDGYHVLFTDVETGEVCLGSERPDADTSGSKFAKRAILQTANMNAVPKCYAAATELSWGVRIAVGYSNGCVWLFSVPRDMFVASCSEAEHTQLEWLDQYDTYEGKKEHAETSNGALTIAWPMLIRGIEVAQVNELENVCVDASNGSVAVWGFSADGFLRRWDISSRLNISVRKLTVLSNGDIVGDEDDDGDWIMKNAPWVPSYTATPPGYDGTNSATSFQTAPNTSWQGISRRSLENQASNVDSGYASATDGGSERDSGIDMMDTDDEEDDDDDGDDGIPRPTALESSSLTPTALDTPSSTTFLPAPPTPMDLDTTTRVPLHEHDSFPPRPSVENGFFEDEGYESDDAAMQDAVEFCDENADFEVRIL
ncbi:MAG: hypothetical protein Q9191_002375 [Dirinaria sp. TL-2023a]